MWTTSIKKGDQQTFEAAAVHLVNERNKSGEATMLSKVHSGAEIVEIINSQGANSIESLDIISHASPVGIHIAKKITPEKASRLQRMAHVER